MAAAPLEPLFTGAALDVIECGDCPVSIGWGYGKSDLLLA